MKMLIPKLLLIPFLLFPAYGATLKAPEVATAGDTVKVSYTGDGNPGDKMTIGDSKGIELEGTNPADLAGDKAGTIDLLMPETAGSYQILYVGSQGTLATLPIEVVVSDEATAAPAVPPTAPIDQPATQTTIEVPAEIYAGYEFQVNWTGSNEPRDRLVVVDPAANDPLEPISYTYLDPLAGTVFLAAPAEPGNFELIYINSAGTPLAREAITVLPGATETGDLIVGSLVAAGYGESTSVEVILDASGSMLQDQEGEDRIDIAKETLLATMTEGIAPGTPFALRVFGHLEEDSCESELMIPLSPLDPKGMAPIVSEIEAINLAKTPIADSLKMVATDLADATGDKMVVVITDGEETCEGNPAQVIREMRQENPDVRVSIVGYSIADEEIRSDFESWAAIGGGRYFDAPEKIKLQGAFQQAFAIPYVVYSGERAIASGVTGKSVTTLPVGEYSVAFRFNGQDQVKPVTVTAGGSTSLVIP